MKKYLSTTFLIIITTLLPACQTPIPQKEAIDYSNYERIHNPSDEEAIPLAFISPNYPGIAFKNNIEGYVQFIFDILPDGTPNNIRISDSQPEGVFDQEALKAVKRWKFKPKAIDGKVIIQTNMRYRLEFVLES